ncbi:MAG: signal peptidase I [Deltaproteobacteria bacterium]|nr:signal peptidase I [Deltaproteobacteria bacterium]
MFYRRRALFLPYFKFHTIEVTLSWATRRYFVQSYKIPSAAMIHTLEIGDHIIANKFVYRFRKPQLGDIIIFQFPKDPKKEFIKRVVAAGGDTIEIRNKKLFLNDKEVDEDFTIHNDLNIEDGARDNFGPVTVPDNAIIVLGDNRDQSYDSRFWGFVNISAVQGKAQSIYWSWDNENTTVRWDRIGQLVK